MDSAYDLVIRVIAVIAVLFLLLGVFYPLIERFLGVGEGRPEQRFYSIVIGIALFILLLVYRLSRESLAAA